MLRKILPNRLEYSYDLISVLTKKEIKVKYKNNFLGYIWSVAHPLAFALTFYLVFKVIMKFDIPYYAFFLTTGMFTWQAFANSVMAGTNIFVHNASILKRVPFPRYALILATIFNDTFHLFMSIPVLFTFIIIYDLMEWTILWWFLYIPANLLPQLLFTFGVALLVGSANVFFRDLERIVSIGINLWFYMTPIIYSTDYIPEEFAAFMQYNPFFPIITNWHLIFMKFTIDWESWRLSMLLGGGFALVGILVYRKLSPKFTEAI